MKKLVKESMRDFEPEKPEYYPERENNYIDQYEPWKKTPETNEIMEKMLDEFEKTNSLGEEVDYDTVWLIKWALWVGYNFK